MKTLRLLVNVGLEKRTLFFYIYYVWSGLELAFAWSRVPRYLEVNVVPWAFVAYGVGLFLGALAWISFLRAATLPSFPVSLALVHSEGPAFWGQMFSISLPVHFLI